MQQIGFGNQICLTGTLPQMRYSQQFVRVQTSDHFKVEFLEIVIDVRLKQIEELHPFQQVVNYFGQAFGTLRDCVRILWGERLRKISEEKKLIDKMTTTSGWHRK